MRMPNRRNSAPTCRPSCCWGYWPTPSSAYGGPTLWRPSSWFPSSRKKESKDCRAKPAPNAPSSDLSYFAGSTDSTVRVSPFNVPFTVTFCAAYLSSSTSCPSSVYTFLPAPSAYLVPCLTQYRKHSAAGLSFIMCVWPHIASLTTPVNVFCPPAVCARIASGTSTAAASMGITFTENVSFIVPSPLVGLNLPPKLLAFRVRFSWLQGAATQRPLLHQREKHGHQNQHMDGGRDHAADDGGGDRFHHVGADAGLPQDGDKARENDTYGHQLRPQTLHRTFNRRFFNVLVFQRLSGCEAAVECFMQIHDHDNARFDGDAEQRDVADPDRHAEVVAEQLLQDEAPRERVERREDEHGGFPDGMEHHVEEHKDDEEHDGKNNLETLLGPLFEFVFSCPLVGVSGLETELFTEEVLRGVHESAIVFRVEVDVHVPGEGSFFVSDHRRASGKRDFGDLLDGNLRAGRSGDEHAAQLLDIVAKIAVVPDVHRIPFAAFDVFGDHFTADPRTDRLLHIGDGQTIAGGLQPVDIDVDVETLRYAFREDGANFRN